MALSSKYVLNTEKKSITEVATNLTICEGKDDFKERYKQLIKERFSRLSLNKYINLP